MMPLRSTAPMSTPAPGRMNMMPAPAGGGGASIAPPKAGFAGQLGNTIATGMARGLGGMPPGGGMMGAAQNAFGAGGSHGDMRAFAGNALAAITGQPGGGGGWYPGKNHPLWYQNQQRQGGQNALMGLLAQGGGPANPMMGRPSY